jgi:LysM repeat protein
MVSNYYLLGRPNSSAGAGIEPAKDPFPNANLPALGSTVQPRQEISSTPSGEIGIGGRLHRLTKSTTPSFEVAAVQMLLQHYTKNDSPVTGLMAQKDIASAVRFPQQYPHAQLSLEKGAEGGLVRDVQARLKMIGFLDVSPTGKIAEKTQSAIARFQSSIAELAAQPLGVLTIDTLAHILRKSEWTPGVRATTQVSPEFKSQGANPSNVKGFDHKLLAEMEGHFRTKGYTLPPKEYPSAGITISNGVDLGQWSRESLLKIGVSEALVNKLDNQKVSYLLLRGKDAEAYLKKHPLSISPAESKELYEKVFAKIVSQFADTYDRRRAPDAPRFADLPPELKTAVGSMAFNMGPSFTQVTGDGAFSRWRRALGAEIFAGNYDKVFQLLVANPHPKEGLQNRRWKEAAIVLEHISARNPDAASKLLGSVTSACAKANKATLVQNFKRIANEFRPGLLASIPPSHASTEADVATTKPKSHTPEPSPDQKRPEVHIVRKGDTLYALAKRFDCSVEELQKANNLKSTALSIGQKLRIPDGELADNAPRPGIRTVRPVS